MRFHHPFIFWAALSACLLPSVARATARVDPVSPPPAHQGGPRMAQELNLTPEQKAQFQTLAQQERNEIKAVRANTTLASEQRSRAFLEIHLSYQAKRQALLTPEQQAKLKALRQQSPRPPGPARKTGTAESPVGQ